MQRFLLELCFAINLSNLARDNDITQLAQLNMHEQKKHFVFSNVGSVS